ncbi:MAG: hypothetical protein M1819_004559 [Sarea resinae]|nr:MAG: hypothetical protein M1819_004559 [Sarea resinae]
MPLMTESSTNDLGSKHLNGASALNNGDTNGHINGHTNGSTGGSTNGAGAFVADQTMPIAIVGMSCRFPGEATNPEKLWKLVAERQSAWSEIPDNKFNLEAFWHPDPTRNGAVSNPIRTINVRGGHFLKEDLACFDAAFFGISPNEAKAIDPQHRLQLESAYEALENAGIPMEQVVGSDTGVYTGVFNRDYAELSTRDPETGPVYQGTGNGMAMLSNRVSYAFDLKGPSISIDTACSASLTALHLACQSLRTGESKQAIVGGTNAMFSPDILIAMTLLNFLSADGKSYMYDHRGSGYGRGEGVASLVIKPLEDALRDGNTIRAVIRESATNCDGRTTGITLPSKDAQEALIKQAYHHAGLDPLQTDYFEAHGTGTQAGDPLEAGAIGAVFGPGRPADHPLYVGSVKTNVGHLEGASGLGGIIKATLALEKGFIPPNINFEKPNSRIPLDDWKLKIPQELIPWPSTDVRRASVNSFGYGGSNVHIILDDAENYISSRGLRCRYPLAKTLQVQPSSPLIVTEEDRRRLAFTITANDDGACKRVAADVLEYIKSHEAEPNLLSDLAFTLNERRSILPVRMATVAASTDELAEILEAGKLKAVRASKLPKLGFVFTGQGAQWAGMGKELFGAYDIFRKSLTQADQCVSELGSWSLIEELFRNEKITNVNAPSISQPLCTAIQVALVDLLASWGVHPTAVIGHSSGEIAAAYAAGALSLESAVKIVYYRGLLSSKMSELPHLSGGMAAVGLSSEEAETYISQVTSGKLVIACINSPKSVTISGDSSAIDELQEKLEGQKIFNRKLKIGVAYHSHHMHEIAADYLKTLETLKLQTPRDVEFHSSVHGNLTSVGELDGAYWVGNMVSPVLFSDALESMCFEKSKAGKRRGRSSKPNVDGLVEIGPHAALEGPIKQILAGDNFKKADIFYLSCLRRKVDATQTVLDLASSLFVKGYSIKFGAVNTGPKYSPQLLVDLPSYPWNHSAKHWQESRLSTNYRFRPAPRHDLLGAPVTDFNQLEPRWRNFLRVSENPWIRDHNIQGAALYPAAGMMIMAIEAMRQVEVARIHTISSFKLREISISKALVVPETPEGVETLFSLRPFNASSLESSEIWHEFRLFSFSKQEGWSEHCRGLVAAVFGAKTGEVDGGLEGEQAIRLVEDIISSCESAGLESVEIDCLYEAFDKLGLRYGPCFRNLIASRGGRGQSLSTISIPDTASFMPYNFEYPYLLHPTVFDCALQSMFPALSEHGADMTTPMVPVFIKQLSVSSKISHKPGTHLKVCALGEFKGSRNAEANITVTGDAGGHPLPVIEVQGLKCASLTNEMATGERSDPRRLCFKLAFDDDVDSLKVGDSQKIFPGRASDPIESALIGDIEAACLYHIQAALSALTEFDLDQMEWHHRLFYNWMKGRSDLAEKGMLPHQSAQWLKASREEKQALLENVRESGTEGLAICRLGEKLAPIMRKEIDALELMLQDDLLYSLYRDSLGGDRTYEHMAAYIDKLAHKRPSLEILEIGAGTGGATLPILQTLGGYEGKYPRFSHYDFTDISSGFFEKAQENFKPWGNLISYKRLNVENEPSEQGFEHGKYDLIIAANVLHATANMEVTMSNVRKLLKPGGKLILMEITRSLMRVPMFFGTLPGWWLGAEEGRTHGPTLTEDQWDNLLHRTQYSGLDVCLQDYPDEEDKLYSVLATTAVAPSTPDFPETIIIHNGDIPDQLMISLSFSVQTLTGAVPGIQTFGDSDLEVAGKVCIFLGEFSRPFLHGISATHFEGLRRMFSSARGVLWVTRGGSINGEAPEANLISGLARSIRTENHAIKFITLDLDTTDSLSNEEAVKTISQLYGTSFADADNNQDCDLEFAERHGRLQIPRILGDVEMDRVIDAETQPPDSILQSFKQPGRDLKIDIGAPGLLDTLRFIDDPVRSGPLGEDEVEIEVKATGINFSDIMVTMGQIVGNPLGVECSGIIKEVGGAVTNVKVGDRVSSIALGAFSNYVRYPAIWAQKLPDDMSFEIAASLPIVFTTAYYALVDTAHLQKGETILIHAAAGGVGQAAILLAKIIGAEIFTTVGTLEKKKFIMENYGIPEDHIFSSRDASFAQGVRRMTDNKGVDVILNSLAGDLLRETWNCIAPFGRFVEIGKRDFQLNSRLEMEIFSRNVQFASVDMVLVFRKRKELAGRIFSDVMDLLRKGTIEPVKPVTAYSTANMEDAFRFMQAGKHLGKLVIKSNDNDIVKVISCPNPAFDQVIPRPPNEMQLREDASYLLVGGLGGLGRALSKWMAKNGGKNLIFLSRNGATSESARALVSDLKDLGVNVAVYRCDVSSDGDLAKALEQSRREMPPIRGVVHGGMVLKDSIFEKMSHGAYQDVLRPKVDGTWNLHNSFSSPSDLDFFVMFSSTAGTVGTSSQASYAASSTFQDAMAHYRTARGLPAVTIDLGMILSVGFVAENQNVAGNLERWGFLGIRDDEFLAMVKTAFTRSFRDQDSCQLITGLGTQGMVDSSPVKQDTEVPFWFHDIKFCHLRQLDRNQGSDGNGEGGATGADTLPALLRQAESVADAAALICDALIAKMSKMLVIPLEDLHASEPMSAYGVDSLVAVELRNWLFREVKADVPVFELLGNGSLLAVAGVVAGKSRLVNAAVLKEDGQGEEEEEEGKQDV